MVHFPSSMVNLTAIFLLLAQIAQAAPARGRLKLVGLHSTTPEQTNSEDRAHPTSRRRGSTSSVDSDYSSSFSADSGPTPSTPDRDNFPQLAPDSSSKLSSEHHYLSPNSPLQRLFRFAPTGGSPPAVDYSAFQKLRGGAQAHNTSPAGKSTATQESNTSDHSTPDSYGPTSAENHRYPSQSRSLNRSSASIGSESLLSGPNSDGFISSNSSGEQVNISPLRRTRKSQRRTLSGYAY